MDENLQELMALDRDAAIALWAEHKPALEARGLILPNVTMYTPAEFRADERSISQMALDAQPQLVTDPSSAIPSILTTSISPDVIRVVFAPLKMAKIMGGEQKRGTWLDETQIFPVVEETGEVSSYGDYNNNGRAGVNFNWPNFQSYIFQTIIGYGEREVERAGLLRINYVSDLQRAAANILNRFGNQSYAFGISSLQNYGLLNNPYLSAYITPAIKAWGGTSWFNNGSPAATANEVYNDVLSLVQRLIGQTNGALDEDAAMVLALSPQSSVALKFANSFGVYVKDLLKEGFPNMEIQSAPQYGQQTATNPQGYSTAGNAMQLIAKELDGQDTGYPAFNEKLRSHKIIPELSAWKQKQTSGTWGMIVRMPVSIVGMIGI